MSQNSKAKLLERLAQGNVMFDWGAIVAIDQHQINRLLQEQYMAAFNDLSFLMPFTAETTIGDHERVVLRDVVLGVPQVSFEKATMTNAQVTVRQNILAGNYSTFMHIPGAPPYLARSLSLREDMGYQLEMTAELGVSTGSVDDRGKLMLNLAEGRLFSCNLGESTQSALQIGGVLGDWIKSQEAYKHILFCAMLDFSEYGPLSPSSFAVRTQPAPEGNNPLAAQYGNGAVVLFTHLRINKEPGRMPANPDVFPYLIPDDLTAQGAPAFNSTTLIAAPLRHYVNDQAPGILRQLVLPNALQVDMLERHDPHDHAIFGSIGPSARSYFVEPMNSQLQAAGSQAFVLDNQGQPVSAQWRAANLNLPLATGTMSDSGTYTAQEQQQFQRDQQLTLVSAQFSSVVGEQVRSGLVIESRQPVHVTPSVVTWGEGMPDIALYADTLSGNALTWELLSDQGVVHGELVHDTGQPGRMLFKPFTPDNGRPEVRLQRIRVSDRASGTYDIATVVIFAYAQSLELLPFHVPVLRAREPIAFRLRDDDDHADATWKVFGEGSVDDNGVYTPSSTPSAPVSVIMADIRDRFTGYAIVEQHYQQLPLRWTALEKFEVKVLGEPVCLANGMQQVEVEIVVETMPVTDGPDTYFIPLTPAEMSSIRLTYRSSNVDVEFVEADQEGLAPDSFTWATHNRRNRFEFYSNSMSNRPTALRSPETRTTRRLYVQSSRAGSEEFYAKFQDDNNGWWDSREKEGFITIRAVEPPTPGLEDYTLIRERVENGKGRIHDPGNGLPPDEFGYMLDSIDYWRLSYKQGLRTIRFATLRLEGAAASVRWESEQVDETFFSYLLCGFNGLPVPGEPPPGPELKEDAMLTAMSGELSYEKIRREFVNLKEPAPGEVLFALHRVDDMPYWYDGMAGDDESKHYRASLDQPLMLVLYDRQGTRHRLQVGFPPKSIVDSRNQVILAIY
ncbi:MULTISPECIES: hypothetical protein [unclassified Pseudomonas]|uniref:hypothetical protein n=1 Tax=unclassified Pseudomonas TaxID=196821 RepID=UPI0035BF3277